MRYPNATHSNVESYNMNFCGFFGGGLLLSLKYRIIGFRMPKVCKSLSVNMENLFPSILLLNNL